MNPSGRGQPFPLRTYQICRRRTQLRAARVFESRPAASYCPISQSTLCEWRKITLWKLRVAGIDGECKTHVQLHPLAHVHRRDLRVEEPTQVASFRFFPSMDR